MHPALLSRVTFSSSVTLKVQVTVTTQYDTDVDCVVPAGNYYISNDGQSDDLLVKIMEQFVSARPSTAYAMLVTYDWSDKKIKFCFGGTAYQSGSTRDVRIANTGTSADLKTALGIKSGVTIDSTGTTDPVLSAQYRPAYVWVADEPGMLAGYSRPRVTPFVHQGKTISNVVKTQYQSHRRDVSVSLQNMDKEHTWSAATDYGGESPYPYTYNKGLECWWRRAIQGGCFRFYPNFSRDVATAWKTNAVNSATSSSVTTSESDWTDNRHANLGKDSPVLFAWEENASYYYGTSLSGYSYSGGIVYTLNNSFYPGTTGTDYSHLSGDTFYVMERPYWECVLNIEDTGRFDPAMDVSSELFSYDFSAYVKNRHVD